MEYPSKLQQAVDSFSKLPGVGPKSAMRYVMSLINWKTTELQLFGESIKNLSEIKYCEECGLFSDEAICEICSNQQRWEDKTLCVVERITDCMAIEQSDTYRGVYHILGGVLNPLMGVGPQELKLDNFFKRIEQKKIESVILAINPSVEGDATCSYIKHELPSDIRVERIGFGIPIGGNLEYLDAMTISKALENRQAL
ncbi:MAG: recombination protein RecR [Halobacteriovoraceae bacterium]|nr:recombination protein RecR [Halobacteriovoraceae bacterium]